MSGSFILLLDNKIRCFSFLVFRCFKSEMDIIIVFYILIGCENKFRDKVRKSLGEVLK